MDTITHSDRFRLEELAAISLYATIPTTQKYQRELPVHIPIPYSANFEAIYEGLVDIGEQAWNNNKISLYYLKEIQSLQKVCIETLAPYKKFSDKLNLLVRSLHSHRIHIPGVSNPIYLGMCRINFNALAQLSQDLYLSAHNIKESALETLTLDQLSSRFFAAFRDVFMEFGGFNKTKPNIVEPYNEEEIQKVKKYFDHHRNHRV